MSIRDERTRKLKAIDDAVTALLPFRELRNTGEPANNDAIEVERLCIRVKQAEKKNKELEDKLKQLRTIIYYHLDPTSWDESDEEYSCWLDAAKQEDPENYGAL